jgi:hypothetical protein
MTAPPQIDRTRGATAFGFIGSVRYTTPDGEPAIHAYVIARVLSVESIYWVISRDCNQRCPHCYNDSGPDAPGLTLDQISRCIRHLPDPAEIPVDRIILSGGEVLVWPDLLFHALRGLADRYPQKTKLMVQTNGDLLDESTLDRLLDHRVRRIDVSSMDGFHPKSTLQRKPHLQKLFENRGMVSAQPDTGKGDTPPNDNALIYAFWGATEDQWIGPLWPRGRAAQHGLSKAKPDNDFCGNWSGAKGFLNHRDKGSEINIQLSDVYPCCPMTCRPIGNLLDETVIDILDRCARNPVYQALNEGRPEAMGQSIGISEDEGKQRSRELGNHCLWCDEFFTKHAPELLVPDGITARNTVDLTISAAARSPA